MTGKAYWISLKCLKKYSSLCTKYGLITMKNIKQHFYLIKITMSATHKVNSGGTWVISCFRDGFLFTENIHFSPSTLQIFSVAEPMQTCYSLGFVSL